MKKILITGGTGLVGKHLTKMLQSLGYTVVMLSRTEGETDGVRKYKWDVKTGYIDIRAFESVRHVIHLAGAGIADRRWSVSYKQEILESRILSTRLLVNTIRQHNIQLESFVSTSAIGIYGNNISGMATEAYPAESNFLANVCVQWEAEAMKMEELNIRTAIVRVGVVLAKESGLIPEITKPIRYFVGAALGNGKQLLSWIHIDDLCCVYVKALEDVSMSGVYNAVAPVPISNADITRKMALLLHRTILLPPVPVFVLRILFGEIATTLVANQYVLPHRLTEQNFSWKFPQIDEALRDLL